MKNTGCHAYLRLGHEWVHRNPCFFCTGMAESQSQGRAPPQDVARQAVELSQKLERSLTSVTNYKEGECRAGDELRKQVRKWYAKDGKLQIPEGRPRRQTKQTDRYVDAVELRLGTDIHCSKYLLLLKAEERISVEEYIEQNEYLVRYCDKLKVNTYLMHLVENEKLTVDEMRRELIWFNNKQHKVNCKKVVPIPPLPENRLVEQGIPKVRASELLDRNYHPNQKEVPVDPQQAMDSVLGRAHQSQDPNDPDYYPDKDYLSSSDERPKKQFRRIRRNKEADEGISEPPETSFARDAGKKRRQTHDRNGGEGRDDQDSDHDAGLLQDDQATSGQGLEVSDGVMIAPISAKRAKITAEITSLLLNLNEGKGVLVLSLLEDGIVYEICKTQAEWAGNKSVTFDTICKNVLKDKDVVKSFIVKSIFNTDWVRTKVSELLEGLKHLKESAAHPRVIPRNFMQEKLLPAVFWNTMKDHPQAKNCLDQVAAIVVSAKRLQTFFEKFGHPTPDIAEELQKSEEYYQMRQNGGGTATNFIKNFPLLAYDLQSSIKRKEKVDILKGLKLLSEDEYNKMLANDVNSVLQDIGTWVFENPTLQATDLPQKYQDQIAKFRNEVDSFDNHLEKTFKHYQLAKRMTERLCVEGYDNLKQIEGELKMSYKKLKTKINESVKKLMIASVPRLHDPYEKFETIEELDAYLCNKDTRKLGPSHWVSLAIDKVAPSNPTSEDAETLKYRQKLRPIVIKMKPALEELAGSKPSFTYDEVIACMTNADDCMDVKLAFAPTKIGRTVADKQEAEKQRQLATATKEDVIKRLLGSIDASARNQSTAMTNQYSNDMTVFEAITSVICKALVKIRDEELLSEALDIDFKLDVKGYYTNGSGETIQGIDPTECKALVRKFVHDVLDHTLVKDTPMLFHHTPLTVYGEVAVKLSDLTERDEDAKNRCDPFPITDLIKTGLWLIAHHVREDKAKDMHRILGWNPRMLIVDPDTLVELLEDEPGVAPGGERSRKKASLKSTGGDSGKSSMTVSAVAPADVGEKGSRLRGMKVVEKTYISKLFVDEVLKPMMERNGEVLDQAFFDEAEKEFLSQFSYKNLLKLSSTITIGEGEYTGADIKQVTPYLRTPLPSVKPDFYKVLKDSDCKDESLDVLAFAIQVGALTFEQRFKGRDTPQCLTLKVFKKLVEQHAKQGGKGK